MKQLRIGLVVPHIFMHRDILPHVIFAPGRLALDLADGLQELGVDVTLFTPGPVETRVHTICANLSYFEQEIDNRGDTYLDLLKKHPLTFITLARQVQSEIIAKAYAMANAGDLDIVHVYTNEEDLALPFSTLCTKPVVFTHHDPFNFLVKYKNVFPKYASLPWISMSRSQRSGMPENTNWVANIYHGMDPGIFHAQAESTGAYLAYFGRIIESKGVHLAIAAVQQYNNTHPDKPYTLKIAGKHYADHAKDTYWHERILPELGERIEYLGFIDNDYDKEAFLADADALFVPSLFEEPFGMVLIEALACGTPVIGLDSGAIPEIIQNGKTGFIVRKEGDERATAKRMAAVIEHIGTIKRRACREDFDKRFTLARMCQEHLETYAKLAQL